MFKIIMKLADIRRDDSLANKLRRKRFVFFESLISSVPYPIRIIDIGGSQDFWEKVGFVNKKGIEITLLNLYKIQVVHQNVKSIVKDARDIRCFDNKEVDVIFSNSTIEHVGDFNDQLLMANEIKRVAKRFFLQTPNIYFPIDPHFHFPFFQFLPLWIRVFLVTHFNLGWYKKISDKKKAAKIINSIRLLSKKKLMKLFPDANIYKEKLLGLTKSFIVYDGWE